NRVFGYYLEISKSKLALSEGVPEEYIRKQTLVNAERFITPELKEWEAKIIGAEERSKAMECELFLELRDRAAGFSERVLGSARKLANLDALASIAAVSKSSNYVRPVVTDGDALVIKEGRHPVIEAALAEPFVPNDLFLDSETEQVQILTGPNMAGKSTYLRQAALIAVMAQAGSFVPAASAEIGVIDRIFTRVGASDDISRGQSTFMVEMIETANILNNATSKSLIILDEIGRGTSTFDGLSIAWAVAEYIHDSSAKDGPRAKTLFATHYHELTELSLTKERVKNYNMAVKEWEGEVVFLRKVVEGGTSRSYGIHVAKLAGLPAGVIKRAFELLENLERGELDSTGVPLITASLKDADSGVQDGVQPSLTNLFSTPPLPDKTLSEVRELCNTLDLDTTSPKDALDALYNLKEILDSAAEDS
ncbi:MAG: DNA mismatch repair protein MutS, partial [Thermodesulfobacteriota bacterium]